MILEEWSFTSQFGTQSTILPDGCSDLILKTSQSSSPVWFVSPLQDCPRQVALSAGVCLYGFRLHPGVNLNTQDLLASLSGQIPESGQVVDRIDHFGHLSADVADALACLAEQPAPVPHAARQLGISQRSLQRLMIRETGRTPLFWQTLARVRQAARAVQSPQLLVDIACSRGYADQSHMTREFRRWLGITPAQLRRSPELCAQIGQIAYP